MRIQPLPALMLAIAVIAGPAAAQSPGVLGDTDLPFGSTDTTDQAWAGYGGPGGSTTKVDHYGTKNWPCYPAGQWAGSKDFHLPKDCPEAGGAAASTTPAAK